jgi:hypothetical protein
LCIGVYFLVPADALPAFFPGHETGLMRIRAKHDMLSGALGIMLLALSWWMGREIAGFRSAQVSYAFCIRAQTPAPSPNNLPRRISGIEFV